MAGGWETTRIDFDDATDAAKVAAYDFNSTAKLDPVNDSIRGLRYNPSSFVQNESGISGDRSNGDAVFSEHKGGGRVFDRRRSYPVARADSDIKFDESDCDEDMDGEDGTLRHPPPPIPSSRGSLDSGLRSHPKLPDYEALVSRFEALKTPKSKT